MQFGIALRVGALLREKGNIRKNYMEKAGFNFIGKFGKFWIVDEILF